jgi:hypothetical protein
VSRWVNGCFETSLFLRYRRLCTFRADCI